MRTAGIFLLGLLWAPMVWAQAEPPVEEAPPVQVESIVLGGHPEDTRLLIGLSRPVEYRVIPDYPKKRLALFIRNARLMPGARSKVFADTFLDQIVVSQIEDTVKITVLFKSINTRFVHFLKQGPPQIVVDLKGSSRPILRTGKGDARSQAPAPAGEPEIPGIPKSRIRELVRSASEEKLKAGEEVYQNALKLFQAKQYPEALKEFRAFTQKYPESPNRPSVAYLTAESLYNIAFQEPYPDYEEALKAYKYAMRTYPESTFYDHALFKAASIYEDLHYILEARTLYLEGIRRNKRSRYNPAREVGLAKMMLRDGQYEEAYAAFQRLLRKTPKDPDARAGIFEIARWHYDRNDYDQALKVYEDAVFRWPEELNDRPEVNYYIGEIYYAQKRYGDARKYYYNLVNLEPDSETAHKSLNRIGDSYLFEDNGPAALSVFNKSRRTRPGSPEARYGTLRLADVGVRYPALPVRDMLFEVQPYFHPHSAYDQVTGDPGTREVLAEATLSKGRAFLKEQRYLEALNQFKKLIPFDPESRFHRAGKSLAHLALVHLIEQYSGQEGYLPTLYAYSDFLAQGAGDVTNIRTLLQIGEAYKGIGMNAEALKFFERVKLADSNGAFTDRLFLDLGEIHLEERNYDDAERVARIFLNKYKFSPRILEAKKILAGALRGKKQFDQARAIYNALLKQPGADPAEIHYLIAETHFAAGDLRKAARSYRKTLDLHDRSLRHPPEYVQNAYYKLGIVLHMQKRYANSLDALKAGRLLFPEHSLRAWGDYLIVDNLEQLNQKTQAEAELRRLLESKEGGDLIQQAAETRLKVLDWENRLKDQL